MNDNALITTLLYKIAANPNKWISLSKSDSQETNDIVDRCLDLGLIKETSRRTYRLREPGKFIVDNAIDYDQYLISKMSDNEIIKNALTELYEDKYATLNISGKRIERIEKRLLEKGMIEYNSGNLIIPSLTSLGIEFVESGLEFDVWLDKKEAKPPVVVNSGLINNGTINNSSIETFDNSSKYVSTAPEPVKKWYQKITKEVWVIISGIIITIVAAIIVNILN